MKVNEKEQLQNKNRERRLVKKVTCLNFKM